MASSLAQSSRVQQATSPALLTYSAPLNQPGPNQYRNCNDASLFVEHQQLGRV